MYSSTVLTAKICISAPDYCIQNYRQSEQGWVFPFSRNADSLLLWWFYIWAHPMILPAVSKYTYRLLYHTETSKTAQKWTCRGHKRILILKKKEKKKVKEEKIDTFSFQTMIEGFLLKTFFPYAFQETNTYMLEYIKWNGILCKWKEMLNVNKLFYCSQSLFS